jgi:NDP-sugar pyrophosphorylase family protein
MDMPDLLREVLSEELPISVFPIVEKWLDVGTPEDLDRARQEFQKGNSGWVISGTLGEYS